MEIKIDNKSIEEMARQHIAVAVADVLSRHSDVLIRDIVTRAINEKSQSSYGRLTIIEESIAATIRAEANNAAKEWLDGKREEIRKQVFAKLAEKKTGLLAKVVDQLVVGLGSGVRVDLFLEKNRE